MRRPHLAALALLLTLVPAQTAHAQEQTVLILDAPPSFVPANVDALLGERVRWTKPVGTVIPHNVVQDVGLFRSGDPTDGAIDYTILPSAGRFHYYCEVHGSPDGGMAGVVAIPPRMIQSPDGRPFTIRWALAESETGRAFDVRYRVDEGRWRVWKRDTARKSGVFGRDGEPVRVRSGHFYDLQARSQLNRGTPGAHSDWSPFVRVPVGA